MKGLICSFLCAVSVVTAIPLNYEISSESSISLTDVSTEIGGMKSIFNNHEFLVSVDLAWDSLDTPLNQDEYTISYKTYVDKFPVDEGEMTFGDSFELPSSINTGNGIVMSSGRHNVMVSLTLGDKETTLESKYMSYNAGVSLIPIIVVLIIACTLKMVELSLGFGIFVGACMLSGNIVEGFKDTLSTYVLGALADEGHGYVYLFSLFMSGFVGMVEKSGGLLGFTQAITKYARTSRSAQMCGFATGIAIFFDDYANILVAGSSLRSMMDIMGVSREKLAYIVDATAAPIASLVPLSSWVGFEAGLIQVELDKLIAKHGTITVESSGFAVFLQTIKYRYYPIFMLMLIPMNILSQRDFGPMLVAERKVKVYGRIDGGDGADTSAGEMESKNKPDADTPPRAWNMLVPVGFLVFYIFYILVMTGNDGSGDQSFSDMMQSADSYPALLWGSMAAALTAFLLFSLQYKQDGEIVKPTIGTFTPKACSKFMKKEDTDEVRPSPKPLMTVKSGIDSFLAGMENIFLALIVLTLAWASGAIMVDVGLDRLFSEMIVGGGLDYQMLPTVSFVVSLFVAFATGSSWGSMTILFPLLLRPTYEASDGDPIIFYATVAGILSGSVAGDHASPISDTTVLSALSSGCNLIAHFETQAPIALMVVIWSMLVGTIPIGKDAYPNGVAIALGFVAMLAMVVFLSVGIINKTGRYDILTEIYLKFSKNEDLLNLKADTVQFFDNGGVVTATEGGKVVKDIEDVWNEVTDPTQEGSKDMSAEVSHPVSEQ